MKVYVYSLYGLCVYSDIQIPELTSVSTESILQPDVYIHIGDSKQARTENNHAFQLKSSSDKGRLTFHFTWRNIGSYTVSQQGTILVEPHPGATPALYRQGLYGVAAALVSLLKKRLVFHGSAVNINNRAFLILGEKGQGKSTLTTYLLERGHHLISDDITTLNLGGKQITALPGPPVIRLWPNNLPETMTAYSRSTFALGNTAKKGHILNEPHSTTEIPVSGAVILQFAGSENCHALSSIEKIMWLSMQNYFFHTLHTLPLSLTKQIMDHSAIFASTTKVWLLQRPPDAERIGMTAQLVERLLNPS